MRELMSLVALGLAVMWLCVEMDMATPSPAPAAFEPEAVSEAPGLPERIRVRRSQSQADAVMLEETIDLAEMIAEPERPTSRNVCDGTLAVGAVCSDGSVYAGNSPDGNVPMYVTRCDLGQTWDGKACIGTRILLPWNDGTHNWHDTALPNCVQESPSTNAACNSGKSNSAFLSTADSSSAAGAQPHQAVQACESLNEHGKDDWYLPSQGELYVMKQNGEAIGNLLLEGRFYWSSSERSLNRASRSQFNDCDQFNCHKNSRNFVRCVRR